MSLGYCASAILETADENTLLYFYCSYNLNEECYKEHKDKFDGDIIINRKSLVKPDVYTKRIRKPSGKKVFEERIRKKSVDLQNLLTNGDVEIENSSGAWQIVDGYDMMALRLVRKIFDKYQEERDIPERVDIFQ